MRITHLVVPTGHFITIHKDNVELTIRTEKGRASELAQEAHDMRVKANKLIRNADLIRDAIRSGELSDGI